MVSRVASLGTLAATSTGTHLRMEQLGFRPDQQQAYQGARGEWQQFFEAWSRCRIGLLHGLAANDPQGKAITSGIKTGVVASHADDVSNKVEWSGTS